MIAALLLAAGAARRFGAPKLLEDLDGKTVVRRSAEAVQHAPVDQLLVVVPPDSAGLRRALDGMTLEFVENPDSERGMGSSIACGVAALPTDVEAVMVMMADEPAPDRGALLRVVETYRTQGASIVVPTYRGERGHPVLFDRSVFPELRTLSGDRGAREIVNRTPERVAFVEMNATHPIDVDTPDDLARLRATRSRR